MDRYVVQISPRHADAVGDTVAQFPARLGIALVGRQLTWPADSSKVLCEMLMEQADAAEEKGESTYLKNLAKRVAKATQSKRRYVASREEEKQIGIRRGLFDRKKTVVIY